MPETEIPETGRIYETLTGLAGSLSDPVDKDQLAQEILDFLSMAEGVKPVYLLGRGLEPPQWIADLTGWATDFGFRVVEGPFWDATPFGKFPGWYKDYTLAQLAPFTAVYICLSEETAHEIGVINRAGGRLSMSTEARMLGYPECCVVAHYDRAVRYHQAIFAILQRLAGGDEGQMQALLRGGAALAPKTQGEIAHMEAAFDVRPAPFGSWNQCPYCARDDNSPSAALSQRYRALAETIDPEWFKTR